MMNNSIDIVLSVSDDLSSHLKRQVYENELKDINYKYPLKENQVDIQQIYLTKNTSSVEVGFFIRNTRKESISMKNIVLALQDKKGNILLSQKFNFSEEGDVPSLTAKPFTVNFDIPEGIVLKENEDYTIKFAKLNSLKIRKAISTELEYLPLNISFELENEIKSFVKDMEPLHENEFNVTFYRLLHDGKNSISCILILRNGTDEEINFEKFPVSLVDEDGNVVARKIFEYNEDLLRITPGSARVVNLIFESSYISGEIKDLSKCDIQYK